MFSLQMAAACFGPQGLLAGFSYKYKQKQKGVIMYFSFNPYRANVENMVSF